MVLPKFLSKTNRPKHLNTKDKDPEKSDRSAPSSPEKRSSPTGSARSSHERDDKRPSIPPSKSSTTTDKPNLSPTKSSQKSAAKIKRSAKSNKDANIHPLNLPPELRRLSALSANKMSASDNGDSPMSDVERQQTQSPAPNSSVPTTPSNGYVTSPLSDDKPPPPPIHRTPTNPTPQNNEAEAEAFKAAGNKFFKSKEFTKAIAEYTKGMIFIF